MAEDYINNEEILYRSVSLERADCRFNQETGQYDLSSQAFRDRNRRPSVDRAVLCNRDPSRARMRPTDGVVSLIVSEVRAEPVRHNGIAHVIDAEYKPLADNVAHAELYGNPNFPNDRAFEKFKTRLVRLAENRWEISPAASVPASEKQWPDGKPEAPTTTPVAASAETCAEEVVRPELSGRTPPAVVQPTDSGLKILIKRLVSALLALWRKL